MNWRTVHERLLQTLPVRTHHRPADPEPRYEGHPVRTTIAAQQRRRLIRQWAGEGASKKEMASRLEVNIKTIENHLNAIKQEDRRK